NRAIGEMSFCKSLRASFDQAGNFYELFRWNQPGQKTEAGGLQIDRLKRPVAEVDHDADGFVGETGKELIVLQTNVRPRAEFVSFLRKRVGCAAAHYRQDGARILFG